MAILIGFAIFILLAVMPKAQVSPFNHEGPEEGVSIYSSCICDLRDLRGEIIIGRKLLELPREPRKII